VRSFEVRTNSLGMRDREVPLEPAAGTWRILVVGDSVAFGEGLPVEKTFPALLEQRLQVETHLPVEVLNGGVEGYNTVSELAFLRDVGVKLHPQTVVVAFNLNDWDRAPAINQAGILTRDPHPERRLSLLERSELASVARVGMQQALARFRGSPTPSADERGFLDFDLYISAIRKHFWANPKGEGLAELEKGLSGFADDARKDHVQIVVAIIPDGDQLHTDKPDLHAQAVVRALCDRYGLPWIDLYQAFREAPEWPLFFDIMHPNGIGHEIIARELARYLSAAPPEIRPANA
jgi:lysophospholipase L1-like esterase